MMAFAQLGELRITYRVEGRGPGLLLLHGAEADHTMFDGLMAQLSDACTVIAFDQRDCGQTQNPAQWYSLVDLADDAARLITHLNLGRVHVFGTSLGGTIAQVLASRHPQKVDRLILGSTWRVGRRLADFNPSVAHDLAALRADGRLHAPAIAEYFFSSGYLRAHPQAIEIFRSTSRTDAQRARRAHMQAHPPEVDLSTVKAPTLLLAGRQDRLIPHEVSFAMASEIPCAECVLVDRLPHVGAVEAPALVAAEILRFLATGEPELSD